MKILEQIEVYANVVEDTRNKHYTTYTLKEIILTLLVGKLCGLRDFEAIAEYWEENWESLKDYISNHRPPCAQTLENVISALVPEQLELCLNGIFRGILHEKFSTQKNNWRLTGKQYAVRILCTL